MHFFLLPQLFTWANTYLQLPGWVASVSLACLGWLMTLFIYRKFLWESAKYGCRHLGTALSVTALGLVLYFASSTLFSMLTSSVYSDYANLNDGQVIERLRSGGIFVAVGAVVFAPILEEAIFRGLLFRSVYDRSPLLAWSLSIGAFSLVHVLGYIGQYEPVALFLSFVQYLPAGFCLALAYRLSGTFLCPVLMHMAINLIGILYYFP